MGKARTKKEPKKVPYAALRTAARAAADYDEAHAEMVQARQRMNTAVKRAHTAGASYRVIGEWVGLTFSRVSQIVTGKNPRR